MIGLVLGTSEGKKIISKLNEFTQDLVISTATEYGGELLEKFKFSYLNTEPLNKIELKEFILEKGINSLIDASHPYAVEITANCMEICKELNIEYIRYERLSCTEKYRDYEMLTVVDNYEALHGKLNKIQGTIFNTTGSRNIGRIINLGLENRIIHRVLPSLKVIEECYGHGVKLEDIIAMKGPFSEELNSAFIKEYNFKAMILKDSGIEGGTDEKLKACIENKIHAFVIGRNRTTYDNVFNDVEKMTEYIKEKYFNEVNSFEN